MAKRSIHPVPPPAEPPGGPHSGHRDGTSGAPAHTEQAEPLAADQTMAEAAVPPRQPGATPSLDASAGLVWPPPEDDLNEWEVLHLHSSGHTLIEPMKYVPEPSIAAPAPTDARETTPTAPIESPTPLASPPPPLVFPSPAQRAASTTPATSDATMSVPPEIAASLRSAPNEPAASSPVSTPTFYPPFDSPLGEAGLPETQVIEPLLLPGLERALDPPTRPVDPPTTPRSTPYSSGSWPGVGTAPLDPIRSSDPANPPAHGDRRDQRDDTDPGLMTRILPVPRFDKPLSNAGGRDAWSVDSAHAHGPRPGAFDRAASPDSAGIGAGRTGPVRIALDEPVSRPSDATSEARPSLVDTLPTGVKLSSLYPKSPASPPLGPPISAGDALIHAESPAPAMLPAAVRAPAPVIPKATVRQGLTFGSWGWRLALGLLAVALVAQIAWLSYGMLRATAAESGAAPAPGTLVVDSSPAGATVLLDGRVLGPTPFRGDVPSGTHQLEVRSGASRRQLAITLQPATLSSYTVELAAAETKSGDETVATTAAIEVRSDPPGAKVSVGGVARGITPVVVSGLKPGRHQVQVSGPFRSVTRTVTVSGGQQALLVVTPARSNDGDSAADDKPVRPAGGRGTFAIKAPILVRVVRNGDFLGTSEDARIQMPAGKHDITLENDSVGFRESRSIEVVAGRHLTIPIELPLGAININARPWAEVFVDGQRVGQTPVASLAIPVGTHEVVYRHPDYPERRQTVIVKVGVAGRSFIDFTR